MSARMLAILMMFIAVFGASAQDDRLNELNFDEEPLPEETVAYSAIGIGPSVNIFMPNVDDINTMAKSRGLDNMSSPMILAGVEFFTAIGVIPNARIGFSWLTGSVGSTKTAPAPGGSETTLSLEYAISTRSLHAEYAIVPASKLAILPGLGFVWGYSTITMSAGSGTYDWSSMLNTTSRQVLEQSSLCLMPRLSIEYAVTPFLDIRLQGGYAAQISTSDWTANTNTPTTNVPSTISVSGLNAQLGIFVGLFN